MDANQELINCFKDYGLVLLETCESVSVFESERDLFIQNLTCALSHSEHQDSILAAINQFFSGIKRWVA